MDLISGGSKNSLREPENEMTENKEYTINGVSLVENYSENRLQLFFPSIPDADIRNQLKKMVSNGHAAMNAGSPI